MHVPVEPAAYTKGEGIARAQVEAERAQVEASRNTCSNPANERR